MAGPGAEASVLVCASANSVPVDVQRSLPFAAATPSGGIAVSCSGVALPARSAVAGARTRLVVCPAAPLAPFLAPCGQRLTVGAALSVIVDAAQDDTGLACDLLCVREVEGVRWVLDAICGRRHWTVGWG